MWVDLIENTQFIRMLYDPIPELKGVRLESVEIGDEGDSVTICFDMPFYPKDPPTKWMQNQCNAVNVILDLCEIYEISLEYEREGSDKRSSIELWESSDGIKHLSIAGSLKLDILFQFAYLQKVRGYIIE